MKRNRKRNRGDEELVTLPQGHLTKTWHPLSLQHLHQSQFIDVVNGILSGRSELFQGSLRGATGLNETEDILLSDHWKRIASAKAAM